MQSVATWLVARPQNAVLALAATLLLPILQFASGALMVMLVLRQGARLAAHRSSVGRDSFDGRIADRWCADRLRAR